ncbi:hypothetical protein [Brevibacillus humidisoli]|nr:hypothetical protein [Brevibacillus humidisoli]
MWSKLIGEALIGLVSLPLIALQTAEGLKALVEIFAEIAQYGKWK